MPEKDSSENIMAAVKYSIIDGQAFTEDGFLILNLHVHHIPKQATGADVMQYFQTFGEVLKVCLLAKNENDAYIVHFSDPKVAATALHTSCHFFMDSVIRVEPCHSLHQPDGEKLSNMLESIYRTAPTETVQEALILTSLNDDCLEHICKKLPLADQINFALTCLRFYNVMVMASKTEYAYLNSNIFEKWTLLRIRIFLQIVGPNVKKLEINQSSVEVAFYLFAAFCTNVEKLIIERWNVYFLRMLAEKMQLLQELELNSVIFGDEIIVQCIQTLKNLKRLSIKSNPELTGENIDLLNGLEKLSLRKCVKITSTHFKKICENLTNLNYLDIKKCNNLLKTEDYEQISKHLLQLKTLKLYVLKENFNCIAQLPKLKQLEIWQYGKYPIMEEFLKVLSTYQAHQLENLKLELRNMNLKMASSVAELKKLRVFHCCNVDADDSVLVKLSELTELEEINIGVSSLISDHIILQLLENCLKLKHIVLQQYPKLTPEFSRNALKLLQDQRARCLRTDSVHMKFPLCGGDCYDILVPDDFADVLKMTVDYEYCDRSSDSDQYSRINSSFESQEDYIGDDGYYYYYERSDEEDDME